MKLLRKATIKIAFVACLGSFASCENYLEPEIYSDITSGNFVNETTADNLITAIYPDLRWVYKNLGTPELGTDCFTSAGPIYENWGSNDYKNYFANDGYAWSFWKDNYSVIAKCNTALNQYENKIKWTDPNSPVKKAGIAEAKALRALAYFNLVNHFGGVVLTLNEIQGIKYDYTRSSEQECFNQIVKDLNEAIPDLAKAPAQKGRFSKRAAQHVLANVLLTRSYKSFAGATDAADAAAMAVTAIDGYDITTQTYAKVFDFDNQLNAEVLFAVQYGATPNNTNNKNGLCAYTTYNYIGIARAKNPYYSGASNEISVVSMPTKYFYELFTKASGNAPATAYNTDALIVDKREDVIIKRKLVATEAKTYSGGSGKKDVIAVGDLVVDFPRQPLTQAALAAELDQNWVFQPDNYYYNSTKSNDVAGACYVYSNNLNYANFPVFNKFYEKDNSKTDGKTGERDTFVFRVAETELIAAEAFLKAGDMANALAHFNKVRTRAYGNTSGNYATLTINDILDERARELAGEEDRWAVLKRTQTLESRIKLYNPHVADHGGFDPKIHYLRPIPQDEIQLSDGSLKQNPGY